MSRILDAGSIATALVAVLLSPAVLSWTLYALLNESLVPLGIALHVLAAFTLVPLVGNRVCVAVEGVLLVHRGERALNPFVSDLSHESASRVDAYDLTYLKEGS